MNRNYYHNTIDGRTLASHQVKSWVAVIEVEGKAEISSRYDSKQGAALAMRLAVSQAEYDGHKVGSRLIFADARPHQIIMALDPNAAG